MRHATPGDPRVQHWILLLHPPLGMISEWCSFHFKPVGFELWRLLEVGWIVAYWKKVLKRHFTEDRVVSRAEGSSWDLLKAVAFSWKQVEKLRSWWPGYRSWPCFFPAVWPRSGHFTSLYLSFLICRMWFIKPTFILTKKIEWNCPYVLRSSLHILGRADPGFFPNCFSFFSLKH